MNVSEQEVIDRLLKFGPMYLKVLQDLIYDETIMNQHRAAYEAYKFLIIKMLGTYCGNEVWHAQCRERMVMSGTETHAVNDFIDEVLGIRERVRLAREAASE
jgi:hypothetical protein